MRIIFWHGGREVSRQLTRKPFQNKSISYATHRTTGSVMCPVWLENYYLPSTNVFADPLINFRRRRGEREKERRRSENKITGKYDKYQRQTADNTGIEKLPWRIIVSTVTTRLVDFYFLKHFLAFHAARIHKYEFSLLCQKLEAKFTPKKKIKKSNKPKVKGISARTVGLIFVMLMCRTPAHQHALAGRKERC